MKKLVVDKRYEPVIARSSSADLIDLNWTFRIPKTAQVGAGTYMITPMIEVEYTLLDYFKSFLKIIFGKKK
jgi:hypothetical protein